MTDESLSGPAESSDTRRRWRAVTRRPTGPAPPSRTRPIPPSTSTASSPGSTSTTGCSSSPRTRACPCSSASSSARSTGTTSTSSSWCGSPGCTTRSSRRSTPAAPTRCRPPTSIELIRERAIALRERLDALLRARRSGRPSPSTGSGSSPLSDANAGEREEIEQLFTEPGLPGADPARHRPGPAVPLHLEPVPEPRSSLLRNPEKDEEVAARVKVPKELLRRFLAIGDGGSPSSRSRR